MNLHLHTAQKEETDQNLQELKRLRAEVPARTLMEILLGSVTLPYSEVEAHAERLPEEDQAELANGIFLRLHPEEDAYIPDGTIPKAPALAMIAALVIASVAYNTGVKTATDTTDQRIKDGFAALDKAAKDYTNRNVNALRSEIHDFTIVPLQEQIDQLKPRGVMSLPDPRGVGILKGDLK